MRGHFTASASPDPAAIEWCERHLLARIHRYTVKRLRREIEPVEPRDFMRFLFELQRVAPGTQVSGPDALAGVLAQLEGYEAPASAWEGEILPARVAGYEIAWLDALCVAGRVVWTRLRGPQGGRCRTHCGAGACDADRAAAAAQPGHLARFRRPRGRRYSAVVVACAGRCRSPRRSRCVVLRRTARRHAAAAYGTGRSAR